MLPFEEALRKAQDSFAPLEARRVPVAVAEAVGFFPAEPGRELKVTGEIAAGEGPGGKVRPGERARIFTGAVVPDGADAVVV